ncbi:MAG: hypothetical protein WBG54_10275 [Acidobacteriaceae bacterium]
MPSRGEATRIEIARDILSYLLQHPAAADTFDGIARWRILEEIAMRTVATTESALRWLIEKGFLLEEKIAGRQSIYRLDPGRRNDAELLLSGRKARRSFSLRRSGAR